jgi:hypothetical protein
MSVLILDSISLAIWSPVIEGGAVYIDIAQPNAN